MNRKTVAREWLILVGLSGLGFGIYVALTILFETTNLLSEDFGFLLRDVEWLWGFVLGPYLLAQFARSLMWAIRVTRQ